VALVAHLPRLPFLPRCRVRRFCCPLAACRDKPRDWAQQSLRVSTESGDWLCFRCGAGRRLNERWRPARALHREPLRPSDLVVLDIAMTGSDGPEGLQRVRQAPQVPVLMLTVHDATLDKVKALDLGAAFMQTGLTLELPPYAGGILWVALWLAPTA
jgi:CheY-like chemotaxis protein